MNILEARQITPYAPRGVTPLVYHGASSIVGRIDIAPGLVLKYPKELWLDDEPSADALRFKDKFKVEAHILRELGPHPRIVRYICESHEPTLCGLLFIEAVNGDLQQYLDNAVGKLDRSVKIKWCLQAAQAVEYCHQKGVIHCDLRPANYLLDDKLDISLADFGGSQLGSLSGQGLPDYGFSDPRDELFAPTIAMDIFGLGSTMYTIETGHFPHGSPRLSIKSWEEISAYYDKVDQLFKNGIFPDVTNLTCGEIIQGCWTKDLGSAEEVVNRLLNLQMRFVEGKTKECVQN